PGVIALVKGKRWIAAVAENWWQADEALAAMKPRFAGPGTVDSVTIAKQLDDALVRGEAARIVEIGDPDGAMGQPDVTRRYDIAPALHAAIETASATAHYHDGRLELWIASQAPEAARQAAAKAVGLSLDDVVLYPVGAGGSFDARLEKSHAIEVAQIAREIGRPIQLTWPRAEEAKIVPPRTPVAIRLSARLSRGEDGAPLAWHAMIACPATVREFGHRLFDNNTPEAAIRKAAGEADPLACEGAVPPYAIAHVAVDHAPVELALPTGRLRGNAVAYTAFANEVFIDEIAREAERDPFLYRMALLGQSARMAEVLRRASRLGEWDGGRPGSGQGIAMVRMDAFGDETHEGGGRIACVVKARLAEGGLRVERLSAVADIGRIVNLELARQQIEGGLLFGLGLAAGCSPPWRSGRPTPAGLRDMNLPTLADAPDIRLDFIESEAEPFDPGELGVAVAPPAIANALFAATGRRYRTLPLVGHSE
ncbi:MAG: molybdopterin cofactor-binding domain-containing protein, partial [Qipengyuania sp.]